MIKMEIKLHSVSGPAMNSSGTVYFTATGNFVENGFEAINAILKVAGSDKKAEDLFVISSHPDFDAIMDNFDDFFRYGFNLDDFEIDEKIVFAKLLDLRGQLDGVKHKKRENFFERKIWPVIEENKDVVSLHIQLETDSETITIRAKNDSGIEIFSLIKSMFETEMGHIVIWDHGLQPFRRHQT
jgi:hypothetical protein